MIADDQLIEDEDLPSSGKCTILLFPLILTTCNACYETFIDHIVAFVSVDSTLKAVTEPAKLEVMMIAKKDLGMLLDVARRRT